MPSEHVETVRGVVDEALAKMRQTIGIINFWDNPPAVAELRGALSDLLLFSNIDEILDHSEKIATEVTALAKSSHEDILK